MIAVSSGYRLLWFAAVALKKIPGGSLRNRR
jgi:hypothetical protein